MTPPCLRHRYRRGAHQCAGSGARGQESHPEDLLLVISDGEDQGSTLQEALTAVKAKRLRVHTIGIGSAQESVIPVSFPGERESLLQGRGGPDDDDTIQ